MESGRRLPSKASRSESATIPAGDLVLHHVVIKRFMIRIEAPTWEDFEDVELPRLPVVGATIETKYGTCVVTKTDPSPGTAPYEGTIVCRVP